MPAAAAGEIIVEAGMAEVVQSAGEKRPAILRRGPEARNYPGSRTLWGCLTRLSGS